MEKPDAQPVIPAQEAGENRVNSGRPARISAVIATIASAVGLAGCNAPKVPTTSATLDETSIRAEAALAGQQAADQVKEILRSATLPTPGFTWAPLVAKQRAEAEVLHRRGLMDDAEFARITENPVPRGLIFTM